MKFKEALPGQCFSFIEKNKTRVAIKTEDERACCLSSGELFRVQHNRNIDVDFSFPKNTRIAYWEGKPALTWPFDIAGIRYVICRFLVLERKPVSREEIVFLTPMASDLPKFDSSLDKLTEYFVKGKVLVEGIKIMTERT